MVIRKFWLLSIPQANEGGTRKCPWVGRESRGAPILSFRVRGGAGR